MRNCLGPITALLGIALATIARAGFLPASPEIEASPAPLVFPIGTVGELASAAVTITNAGAATLEIAEVTLSVEPSPELVILSDTGEAALTSSEARSVVIAHLPSFEGPIQGNLTILSNDPNEITLTVPIVAAARRELTLASDEATATAMSAPDLAIPDLLTVTDTIDFTEGGTSIHRVEVFTDIWHPSPGQLQIALTSPSGRIATLSTNNGGDHADVFANVTWADTANELGAVPYDFTPGIATDHPYRSAVPALYLTPEEGLSGFIGEDPNGAWTLTLHDGASGETGTLEAWGLTITSGSGFIEGPTQATGFSEGPVLGPGGQQEFTFTFFSSLGRVLQVVPDLHADTADPTTLQIALQSPSGRQVTLTSDSCGVRTGSGNNRWNDLVDPSGAIPYESNPNLVTDRLCGPTAGTLTLVPEEPLGAFIGEPALGTWVLTVANRSSTESVSLGGHFLQITATPPDTPRIGVTPATVLDFGTQGIANGPTASMEVIIRNRGFGTLEISQVTFSDADGAFLMLSDTGETSLAYDETRTIGLVYDPAEEGLDFGNVVIFSNDSLGSPFGVPLKGNASPVRGIDIIDLLLGQLPNADPLSAFDLNGDGIVDVADLVQLLP